jgi:hypothetical protein
MIRMIFEQCLCCFCYHPEIWIAYSKFERYFGASTGTELPSAISSTASARAVLNAAIEANPLTVGLRVALSELEVMSADENDSELRDAAAQQVRIAAVGTAVEIAGAVYFTGTGYLRGYIHIMYSTIVV